MKKLLMTALLTFTIGAMSSQAQDVPMVGGEKMFPKKNIIENAVNSADHTTLVTAVKAAGLVGTLSGEGPFTVFAPTNAAFDKLPERTVSALLKPENKDKLTSVLTYHVVPGRMDFKTIQKAIKKGKGQAILTMVSGRKLYAALNGAHNIILTDENGGTANVSLFDIYQSNGVIRVIDNVVLPK